MYAVSPYSPHLRPPCLVWIDFTKHEGWELMNFVDVVVVHLPELAKMRFILPRALDERYRIGIPIALLSSQLATGICTKENVIDFELGIKKRFEFGLVKWKNLS